MLDVAYIALGSNLHQGSALATGILGLFCIEAAWRERQWIREGAVAFGGVLALLAIPGGVSNLLSIRDHLHLDDEAGAQAVSAIFQPFLDA